MKKIWLVYNFFFPFATNMVKIFVIQVVLFCFDSCKILELTQFSRTAKVKESPNILIFYLCQGNSSDEITIYLNLVGGHLITGILPLTFTNCLNPLLFYNT